MERENKFTISFGAGELKVGDKPRISLWSLGNDCKSYGVIIAGSSYEQIDSIVTEYAQSHNVGTTIGCQMLNTNRPVLMPVSMSILSYKEYFEPLSYYMLNHLHPPSELARGFLNNINFIDQEKFKIHLKRIAKNYSKGDFFTTDKKGNRVEMFSLLDEMTKPITAMEMYKAKLRLLFKL